MRLFIAINFDNKKFKPHITLAREMHIGSVDSKELLRAPFYCEVNSIDLMLSERIDGKLVYRRM